MKTANSSKIISISAYCNQAAIVDKPKPGEVKAITIIGKIVSGGVGYPYGYISSAD